MSVAHRPHFGDDRVNLLLLLLLFIIYLHEFIRRTDHRRFESCLSACLLNTGAHRSIGKVPEVPRHQKIGAIGDGDGDMGRIVRNLAWYRTGPDQRIRETLRFRCRIEKRDKFKRCKPGARCIRIASTGFRDDKRRCNEIELLGRVPPPLAGDLLMRRAHHAFLSTADAPSPGQC